MTRTRWILVTVICIPALAVLYSAAWYILADRLEDGIARWAAERREDGWTANYASLRLEGFPFAWRARIEKPVLATRLTAPAARWSGPEILLDWRPWDPSRVDFAASGGHRVDLIDPATDGAANLVFRHAIGDVLFGARGRLARLTLALDDAELGEQGRELTRVNRLNMTLDTAPALRKGPVAKRPASLRLTGTILGLTLPKSAQTPLGRTIGVVDIDATIMGKVGAVRRGTIRKQLAAWRDNGGIIEIDRLTLGWARLVLGASGTFAFDANMQPMIATNATVRGHGETLDALVGAGAIAPGEALMTRMAFRLLERSGANGKQDEIRIALTLQGGWLYVGPVKLLRLPPLSWREPRH